jgi:DNA-binding response OmpR family regulator
MKYILALDDSIHLLETFELVLKMQGYEFIGVLTDNLFFDALEQRKPDLILLDIQIGNINGKDLCKRIKEQENCSHIPIILVSGHSSQLQNYTECGAKPFGLSELLNVIHQFL